jgi:hypothetical protein
MFEAADCVNQKMMDDMFYYTTEAVDCLGELYKESPPQRKALVEVDYPLTVRRDGSAAGLSWASQNGKKNTSLRVSAPLPMEYCQWPRSLLDIRW